MRERILSAAADLTLERGWASVTMSDIAARVGVSRQTIYNEMGSRPALAEAMVVRELGRFLVEVNVAFDAHPGDPALALSAAAGGVLRLAVSDPLLRAVLAVDGSDDGGLLPYVTVRGDAVISAASSVVLARLNAALPDGDPADLARTADLVVRTVLSHVVRPGADPETTAEEIGWAAERLLGRGGRTG